MFPKDQIQAEHFGQGYYLGDSVSSQRVTSEDTRCQLVLLLMMLSLITWFKLYLPGFFLY